MTRAEPEKHVINFFWPKIVKFYQFGPIVVTNTIQVGKIKLYIDIKENVHD